MNKIFKITGFLSIVISLFFVSCLKDDSLTLNTSLSNSVIEFANTGSIATNPSNGAAPRFNIDLGSLEDGDTASFNVNVDYAGAKFAPEDISVTIDIDTSLLSLYNSVHSVDAANYTLPPLSAIKTQFPITIIIPKGQQFGQGHIVIERNQDYDFTATYALPLKIVSTSAGDISGNFGTALYNLNIRNAYDGVYFASGTMIHPSYGGEYSDQEEDMITTGATSVQFQLTTTVTFSVYITLTVDPATNLVTVTTGDVVLDAYDPDKNYYDPAAKTFHLDFGYSGGSRHITMTAVYNGPR
jgi:hypothetical protein